MKQFVRTLTIRTDNEMPALDTDWVLTADNRLWLNGAYKGALREYTLTPKGIELDYAPRPVVSRTPGRIPEPHPLCRCPDGHEYDETCPIHPMPHRDPAGAKR